MPFLAELLTATASVHPAHTSSVGLSTTVFRRALQGSRRTGVTVSICHSGMPFNLSATWCRGDRKD
ncbi:hypothetical protein ARSEF1564_010340, partial [Beauveria bassiana]